MGKILSSSLLVFVLAFGGMFSPVRAQDGSTPQVSLYNLQTKDFPTITAGLDVIDSAGNAVTGLTPGDVTLVEDNQPLTPDSLVQVQVGVKFALALDPGPTFAYRDVDAVTRYDKIIQVLKDWANSHSDSFGDDLSLIPTYGVLSTHLASTSAFLEALNAYQPNLGSMTPSLNTLARALDAVTEQNSQSGMKRSVLFVTSPTSVDDIPTLQNLTERAVGQQVRVNVWIVASTDFFSSSGATALKDLAIQSGGQYVLFSGQEPLPGLETYLAPLRTTYHLTFTSAILTPGGHAVTAQVNLNGAGVTSSAVTFNVDIQPPNPMLVAPPEQIVRQAPDSHSTNRADFLPKQQDIEIIVEFPDNRPRPLVSTALFVDGQKVAENNAEPFTHFTWDISAYDTSGEHVLNVEAVDSYGLKKTSIGIPVMITVVRPQFGLIPFLYRNSIWVTLAAILFAGIVLGGILLGGRRRRRLVPANHRGAMDPLTQPVVGESGRRGMRPPWKQAPRLSEAYLERLKEDGEPVLSPSIPVVSPEMTFGSDPLRVTHILDDASVSPLHARIREKNGEYILTDEKSVAGTWVNYEILEAPRRLRHGDVLQIGRLSYRFMLRKPPVRPAPKVTPTKKT
jgi:hypothetical protein